jgi:hypothetical protein
MLTLSAKTLGDQAAVASTTDIDLSTITGYAPEDRYLATRYIQGNRTVFDFELPLEAIPQILPVPDPERPTTGNRKVKPGHAKGFATYVRENEEWVCPALLLRAPDTFTFETNITLGGVTFGVLGVPRSGRRDLRIIDGQHRILGLHYAVEDIARELDDARGRQAAAQRDGNVELAEHVARIVERLDRQRRRLASEHLAVQVHVETDQKHFEQMFFDVADNQLGITQAVKVRFDSRKVMNRTLDAAQRHALLNDRVDQEQDRIGGSNPNLLGARHVVDIVRTVNVGILGRVSRRQEAELDEGALVQRAHEFFDILVDAFPELTQVADGQLTPEALRGKSLLGSSTMLRILAGAYYELTEKGYSDDEVADLFGKLAPHTSAPLAAGSPWLTIRSKVFFANASAPASRHQDMRYLADEIASWIDPDDQPMWLSDK